MRICVFCGSSKGRRPAYARAASDLGQALAGRGIGLVYGGAHVGTMGVLADAVLRGGGEVTGVIPRQMVDREIAHTGVTDLQVVADMHERKARMASLADAFVALPGGAGTLEELFEAWTWGQLGLHAKPCGLLDVAGYYAPLRRFVDHMVAEEYLRPEFRSMLLVDSDPARLIDRFAHYEPPEENWAVPDPARLLGISPGRQIDALAWVHIRDGRVLMVRTRDNDALYLPGGKREPGESDVQALAREIREELGVRLDPQSLTLLAVVTDAAHGFADGTQVRMACYLADHCGRFAPGAEVRELAWVGRDDAGRCAPAGRQVLDELHARSLLAGQHRAACPEVS